MGFSVFFFLNKLMCYRLDQGVKATSNLSKRAVTRSNPESYGNVCELENFLATSTIKV